MERSGKLPAIPIVLGVLLQCCVCAFALNPDLDINQYAHNAWRVRDGFFKGIIFDIAQTLDGYLWIATDSGLVRFDGVRSIPWQPPAGMGLPSSDVRQLYAARDGRLWIGTTQGVASWKDGRLTQYPAVAGQSVVALLEDRQGTMWVGTGMPSSGRLCRIQGDNAQCYGEDGRFGTGVTPLYEDSKGNLWVGAMTGLWRWKPGPPVVYAVPDPGDEINSLIESDDGGILVAKNSGITKLRNGKAEVFPFPLGLEFEPGRLFRDRDGSLWIGSVVDSGLLHIHKGRVDQFFRSNGLSGNGVRALMEDREGSIWVATVDGVDRFREFAVTTLSTEQGLSSRAITSVIPEKDGSMWISSVTGLNKWSNGEVTIYRKRNDLRVRPGRPSVATLTTATTAHLPVVRIVFDSGLPDDSVKSLFQDSHGQIWVTTNNGVAILKSGRFLPVNSVPHGTVLCMAEDGTGTIWLSHREGLFRLHEARIIEHIPWAKLGRGEPATVLMGDKIRGGVWLGFRSSGVAYFEQGQLTQAYRTPEGLGSLHFDPKGTLWATGDGGLSRLKDGRILTLTSNNGLPCSTVHGMMEDGAGSVWLYMACGLVRVAQSELDAWASGSKSKIAMRFFDGSDGVRSQQFHFGYGGTAARSADGKLWFVFFGGVSVLDPHHLPVNKLPPPVHIEQITEDDNAYDAKNGIRLHPRVRNLAIDYTALSLSAPERVHFRFKLDGQDRDWREVVNKREVQYSNLAPGTYTFRVKACNNSGVWNEEGAALDFVIPPMWYQTNWFLAACVAAFLAMIWAIYQLRVRQLAHQFNMRLEERVSERTRIARDLHDTLLQSFQALLLRFQAGINMLTQRPDDARTVLEDALERASQAITEGRDAISGLRMSTVEKNDLAVAIETIAEELAAAHGNQAATAFQVFVEGTSRELNPILRDEIYRLATEALRNAFVHAAAQKIEVEIRYDEKYFRLRVRDDGKGIPPEALSGDGREGHYGLHGMRERAKLVGGKLTIWTEQDSGTEIELVIPGARAYVKSAQPFWYFGKRSATERHEKEAIKRE